MNTHALAPSTTHRTALTLLAGSLLLIGACASTPPPIAEMAVSTAAVNRAVAAGGAEAAPTQMRLAREKLGQANQALENGDNDRALALAQQATLDARVAELKSQSAQARKAADAVKDDRQVLREELERKAK